MYSTVIFLGGHFVFMQIMHSPTTPILCDLICFSMTLSETVSEGILYVAISGESFHCLPGLHH